MKMENKIYYYHSSLQDKISKKIGNITYYRWIDINFTIAGKYKYFNNGIVRLRLGIAICNHVDKFVKATGREIATKQLLENPIAIDIKDVLNNTNLHSIINLIYDNIERCEGVTFNKICSTLTNNIYTKKDLIKKFRHNK